MFSKFTNIFQHAVGALSVSQPQHQDFVHHWKAVTHFFLDKKDHKVSIDQTDIPSHLNQMLEILQEEEFQADNTTGPCMEYVLQHRILETLYTLARTDCPPGMKQQVLQFFTCLLSKTSQPLLPHINVHKAVHRLIRLCGETAAGPTEAEEIQFLCNVCAKLKSDPYLVNFFIEDPLFLQLQTPKSKISAKDRGAAKAAAKPVTTAIQKPVFSLVDSLLSLMHSPDARVGVKACEGLMLAASLTEQSSAHCMVHNTEFCKQLTDQLIALYKRLPNHMDPADIECVEAKWGLNILSDAEDHLNFPGKRALISFLSWLDYCDQLINIAHPIVAQSLSYHIKEHFLQAHLEPAIMQASEAGATTATAHFSRCLRLVTSEPLLSEMVNFTLGTEDQVNHNVRDRLIQRCDHLSEELSITTLKYFETLLQKPNKRIIPILILDSLVGRTYIENTNYLMGPSKVGAQTETVKDSESEVVHDKAKSDDQTFTIEDLNMKDDESDNLVNETQNKAQDKHKLKSDCNNQETDSSMSGPKNTESDAKEEESPSEIAENKKEDAVTKKRNNVESNDAAGERKDSLDVEDAALGLDVAAGDVTAVACLDEPHPVNVIAAADASGDARLMQKQDCLPDDHSESSLPSSPRNPPEMENIHHNINFFLLVLPEWAKSSHQVTDSGYDTYLRDAHRQYVEMSSQCQIFSWPSEPVSITTDKPYEESPLIKVLFDKLSHLLDQSYDVNLQLTSIISRLAMLPHPNLHELLLNHDLSVKEGVRTLSSVLNKVVHDLQSRLKATTELSKKMLIIRKQLIGFSNNMRSIQRPLMQYTGFDDASTLEGVIVLEEFCKELAAITFVKYHASLSR